ncbi:S41 family peptidase [Amorphoplanes digitatis]|uniref:C-terminal processing protease CtpA/Prc n=1 Tax=Actinoplanes digitatis TaxID=1868 RepID=A0A7W7HXG0_9ACTN|nr:S41 family peptidase [Actinoplanes digitatis]MBB4762506.1 C-terminal processing protease CtpA/Prc [Actinoplanes digitatis]
MAEVKLEADHGLGAVRTMPQFRQAAEQSALTAADRQLLLDQAALLIDTVYVHLLHKRAMYAIEPSQRLRLLRHRLARLTDAQFHAELLRIFIELRDLHTNYVLPRPYQGPFAFLGVLLEQFWRDGKPGFLVSKTFPHLTGDPQLVDGAEITHWNGAPIALAVARNADREAGSNADARLARGCESMSLRTLALSAVPDEDWVDLRYLVDGTAHETRLHWRVFDTSADLNGPLPDAGPFAGLTVPSAHLVGLDLRTEVVRQAKKQLFVPAAVDEERRVAEQAGDVPEPTAEQLAAGEIPTTRPDELRARVVTTPAGTFGHLRIFTFHMRDQGIEAFLNEVIRLLDALPKNGLILDVRGNGGGYVVAAEFLLQFLTPRRIQPEPMQLISTDATRQLCASVDDLADWRASVDQAIETGAQYSSAVPLYPADVVNSVGQVYHGPVVLITDALCYSATDIFSAGFQDHEIGTVLGIDEATGAGGANVWTQQNLVDGWRNGPFRRLPASAQFRVALRRCLRVGRRAGEPVEDLGVRPDELHRMTRRDLLEGNADLLAKAGTILAAGTPRRLDADAGPRTPAGVALSLTTEALTSVDVYVNQRPVKSVPLTDAKPTLQVPLPADGPAVIRLEGFDGDTLVAARTLEVSA